MQRTSTASQTEREQKQQWRRNVITSTVEAAALFFTIGSLGAPKRPSNLHWLAK